MHPVIILVVHRPLPFAFIFTDDDGFTVKGCVRRDETSLLLRSLERCEGGEVEVVKFQVIVKVFQFCV